MLNGSDNVQRETVLAKHIYQKGLVAGQFADTLLRVSAPFVKTYALHALVVSVSQPITSLLLASQKLYPVGVLDLDGFAKGVDYLWRADIVLPPIATEHAMDIVIASMYTKFDDKVLDGPSTVPILAVATSLGIDEIVYQGEARLRECITPATVKDYIPLLYTPHAHIFTEFLLSTLAATDMPSADIELVNVFALLQWDLLKSILESSEMRSEHERFEFAKEVLQARNDKTENVVVSIGGHSGIMMLKRGEKKVKKMWKVGV